MNTRSATQKGRPSAAKWSAACLTDTQLALILDGTLLLKREAQAEAHIDACAECRSLLVALLHTETAARRERS